MSFRTMWNGLMGDFPGLDFKKAQDCINYAWRDIREARRWSFLSAETSIDIPDQITAGTATVTQFSDLVVPNAAAKAQWDAAGLNIPLTARQFRVGSGPLYQIIAYDSAGAGSLQLERSYKESSGSVSYSIYRAYFTMPTDFLTLTEVKDIQNGRTLELGWTRETLDSRDPQRQSFGDAYHVAVWSGNDTGPRFELWPHTQTAKSLVCKYERAGTDFTSDSETLPTVIPESLVIEGASAYATRWAMANSVRYSELKGINWGQVLLAHLSAFKDSLERIKIQDEEKFPQNISYSPEHSYRMRGDSRYWQSHAPPFEN